MIITRHFRNGKGNGAEMCPAIVSEIVTGDAIGHFFLALVTVSEVFTKTNSAPSLRSLQAILPKILCAPDVALLENEFRDG